MIRRIAITGPESTGKSTLAENLAKYYNTSWVKEFSREYLNSINRPYEYSDILEIAKGQKQKEETHLETANKFLFCDTEMLVNKIWSEFIYGKCDPWIINQIKNHKYDLYLLTDIDIPWEDDPLREHPDKRKELYEIYVNNLNEFSIPYTIIRGDKSSRFQTAVDAINNTF